MEQAAVAAKAYKDELAAKSRARAAAIAAEKKAIEDAIRRQQEEAEEAERQRIAEETRRLEAEAAERARLRKLEEERLERLRIEGIIKDSRVRIANGCAEAKEANRKWPNRVLKPAPHSKLRQLHTEVLDLLDTTLPQVENHERDFMVDCAKLIYELEVASYPTVKDLAAAEGPGRDALYVEATVRFEKWWQQETAKGRFLCYDPPPYDPNPARVRGDVAKRLMIRLCVFLRGEVAN